MLIQLETCYKPALGEAWKEVAATAAALEMGREAIHGRSGTVDGSEAMIPWEKYMDNMCKNMEKTYTPSTNMDPMCKYMGDVFHVFFSG